MLTHISLIIKLLPIHCYNPTTGIHFSVNFLKYSQNFLPHKKYHPIPTLRHSPFIL